MHSGDFDVLKLVKWLAVLPLGLGIVLMFFAVVWRTWGQAAFAGVLVVVSGLWIAAFARIERKRQPLPF